LFPDIERQCSKSGALPMARPAPSTLSNLRTAELRTLWRKTFDIPPPEGARRDLLLCLLTYELQRRAEGRLPRAIAKQLAIALRGRQSDAMAEPSPALRLGARLIRTWRGTTHEITVVERGFAYRGRRYRSLTEIAQAITGAHWSGPRFFGFKTARGDVA
jgi:hypothetical protein